jgi:hypothetical protein
VALPFPTIAAIGAAKVVHRRGRVIVASNSPVDEAWSGRDRRWPAFSSDRTDVEIEA